MRRGRIHRDRDIGGRVPVGKEWLAGHFGMLRALVSAGVRGFGWFRVPSYDVFEGKDSLKIDLDVPGFARDDIGVSVIEGGKGLRIGFPGKPLSEDDWKLVYGARQHGAFTIDIPVGEEYDPEGVEASLSDGVLSLVVAKKAEQKLALKWK